MQGHFMDMKSAYVFGILKALQKYDPKKGAFFSSFQEYYVKKEIDDYVRTMRTGYTVPSDSEYAVLRKVMVLYALHGYRSDIKTISRISAEVDRKPKVVREMITGAVRNMMYAEFYRMYEDDDGEDGAEDVTSDTSSDPAVVFHDYREFQTLSEAFDRLEYRERAIISAHLAFCPECWGLEYSVAEASEKIKVSAK